MRQLLVALFCLLPIACKTAPGPVRGDQPDPAIQAEILATIDRFFVAMAERDQDTFASLLADTCTTHSQLLRDGEWHLLARPASDSVASLARGRERLVETYWDPTVLRRGPIAVAWTPYRFTIDGKESHCGVNIFDLVQQNGRWRIVNISYTKEPPGSAGLAPDGTEAVRPRSLR